MINSSYVGKILNNLESGQQIDIAINSLTQNTTDGANSWKLFCSDPTVFNALAYLDANSPIFPSLLRFLEESEDLGVLPAKKEIEEKILSYWAYYQLSVVPSILKLLQPALEKAANKDELRTVFLQGRKISAKDRKQLGADFSDSRTVKDLVSTAPSRFPEDVCRFFQ
ncbi:MAG: hypothetical protein WC838_07515 [Candidatus Margulisiibacteriota bacterium]|jgi:hypothetical protein